MVYIVNSVLASGVDIILEEDFVCFALQEMEIHPLMLLILTLSMIIQTFSLTLHNPRTNHTRMNYVGTTLIVVMIVHHRLKIIVMRIDIYYRRECEIKIDKLKDNFNKMSIEIEKKEKELRQQEQAANLSTYTAEPSRRFNSIYDDDDEESTITLNEITSQIIAIIPVLPTMEPEDSLIIGDGDLSTIPEKKSDEFIKSSVTPRQWRKLGNAT
ncbi:hypothetical protein Tco_0984775 [Tanacetum coccineum]